MATNRAFGTQLNGVGNRKPLGKLNIQNNPVQKLKPKAVQIGQYKQADQENVFPNSFKQTESKFDFQIYNENGEQESLLKDSDITLEDNIEAVKRELNSFLIDSNEKTDLDISEDKENAKFEDDSLMLVEDEEPASISNDESLEEISEISFAQQYSEFERLYDYSDSILEYMLELERKCMPDPFYMNNQTYVNPRMRSILVDWLVDVADEYKLKDETLFLCVSYVDRYCGQIVI